MAYRFYSDEVTSSAANASLIQTARGDVVTFTRSARYIAAGNNAHVLSFRFTSSVVVDGALYSGNGATIFCGKAGAYVDVRVGEDGLVSSAAGTAIMLGGMSAVVLNAGEVTGDDGVSSTAAATRIGNDGSVTATTYAISVSSADAQVDNQGRITGDVVGIALTGGTTDQLVTNSGVVSSRGIGIFILTHGDATFVNAGTVTGRIGVNMSTYLSTEVGERRFENSGTVIGQTSAFTGGHGDDTVLNTGHLIGATLLLAGNDTYDGRGGTAGRVDGGDGDDTLTGSDLGRDVLAGGAGDDTLVGGTGNDTLLPGSGSDFVDGGAGRDIVSFADSASGITLSLDQNYVGQPDVHLLSIEGIEGSRFGDYLLGDAGSNWLYGREGNDTLVGGAGSDVLVGGLGNDTYRVDATEFPQMGDRVVEAANGGTDTVTSEADTYRLSANVENLILAGTARYGYGNALANVIVGTAGFNALAGNGGGDTLTGGGGADQFGLGTNGASTITDFGTDDGFFLYRSEGFSALSAGTLSATAFYVGAGAHDADDRIIFNAANNTVSYDPDGTGATAQIAIALLGTEVTPTPDMFTIS